jgi:3-hydroxybutyryl-CoA dehydratase
VSVSDFTLDTGKQLEFRTSVSSERLGTFADLSEDHAPHHVDADAARAMGFEREIVHGLLVLSLTGQVTSEVLSRTVRSGVTYGYDRVRFMKPVYVDEKIIIRYRVKEIRTDKPIVVGALEALQRDAICMTADHLLFLT